MKIILFGAQGAGKGTIGAMLSEKYHIPLLGTGQILRAAIKEGTEVGKIAEQFMNKGNLVPDEVTANVINERVRQEDCKNGYILDGFPRTLSQASLFAKEMHNIDFIFALEAPRELLIHRLTGRRQCQICGAIYNIYPDCNPNPKEPGKCDKDGGGLYQREDDTKEKIEKRLSIYEKETKPILDKYKDQVVGIDSSDNPQAILGRIVAVLEKE